MKTNLPVTQHEIPVQEGIYLVSQTDLKGVITDANEAFVAISGFSCDELIGSSHNIVRHPDMPPAAFADMWASLKAGMPLALPCAMNTSAVACETVVPLTVTNGFSAAITGIAKSVPINIAATSLEFFRINHTFHCNHRN